MSKKNKENNQQRTRKVMSLSDLASVDMVLAPEPDLEVKGREDLHRVKNMKRPEERFILESLSEEAISYAKTQKDPTEDLVEVPCGLHYDFLESYYDDLLKSEKSFLVFCLDTVQTWYAHNEICLNKNFIYREDLVITNITSFEEFKESYLSHGGAYDKYTNKSKFCRILDFPPNETYEVYYDSTYVSAKYGKATPSGSFVHKYENRFHRDMQIMALDKLYTNSSLKSAKALTKEQLNPNEAIIITDGAWIKEQQASSLVYIDNVSVVHMTEGRSPEDKDQAVLLSEINGALMALKICYMNKKTKIIYYYDNTSILNVFRNKKNEYLETIKEYKEFVHKLHKEGYNIDFYELHPKSDDNKDNLNKALCFFHKMCDSSCITMADICKKDISKFISETDTKSTYNDIKQMEKPKGNNRGNRNGNNNWNGKK